MSLLSWISGYDEENAAAAAQADVKLRELNRAVYGVDYVNRDDYLNTADAEKAISDDFRAGLEEGWQNIKGAVNGVFTGILGTIPWSVWLLLAVGLFIWLGGLSLLRGRLAR